MINYGYKLDNIWLRIYKSNVLFKTDILARPSTEWSDLYELIDYVDIQTQTECLKLLLKEECPAVLFLMKVMQQIWTWFLFCGCQLCDSLGNTTAVVTFAEWSKVCFCQVVKETLTIANSDTIYAVITGIWFGIVITTDVNIKILIHFIPSSIKCK